MNIRSGPSSVSSLSVVCAWCGLVLVEAGPVISHGLCEACAESMSRSLRREALTARPLPEGEGAVRTGE